MVWPVDACGLCDELKAVAALPALASWGVGSWGGLVLVCGGLAVGGLAVYVVGLVVLVVDGAVWCWCVERSLVVGVVVLGVLV